MTVSVGSGNCSGRPEVGSFGWIRTLVTGDPAAERGALEARQPQRRLTVDGGMAGLRLRARR